MQSAGLTMKPFSEGLKIVIPETPELSKRPPVRAVEPLLGDVDNPNRLMDLLGDIDTLKLEIHERIRRMEAVKQAKSVLLEDAARTEALSKKLAEIGKVMSAAQFGFLMGREGLGEAEPSGLQLRAGTAEDEARYAVARVMGEGMALPWPKAEGAVTEEGVFETTAAGKILESPVDPMGIREFHTETYHAISGRLAEVEKSWRVAQEEFERATGGSRQQLEEASKRLNESAAKEQQAAADYQAAQEVMRAAYRSIDERAGDAEHCWRQAEQAAAEAKRLLDESAVQLRRAISIEEQAASEIRSSEKSILAAFQSAMQRLDEAKEFWKEKDRELIDSKKQLDQSTFALTQAQVKEEAATADLVSARQELTTAYQFASVAAQRRQDASEFFRKAAGWTVFATAISWIAMVWAAWFSFRATIPIWGPGVASVLLLLAASAIGRRGKREAQGE